MDDRSLLPADRLDTLVRRRVAVFWNDDRAFYPAFVERRIGRRRRFKVVYEGEDEDHVVQSEYLSFDSTPVVALPDDPRPPCGVCGHIIDLSGRMECTLAVSICFDCSAAYHLECTFGMAVPSPRQPWHPEKLSHWRCPSCLAAAEPSQTRDDRLRNLARSGVVPRWVSRIDIRLFPSAVNPTAVLLTNATDDFITHAKNYVPGLESAGGSVYVAPFASFEVLVALKERLVQNRPPSAVAVPTSPPGAQAYRQRGDALPRINSTVASQAVKPRTEDITANLSVSDKDGLGFAGGRWSLPPISTLVAYGPSRTQTRTSQYTRVGSAGSEPGGGLRPDLVVLDDDHELPIDGDCGRSGGAQASQPLGSPPCYSVRSSGSEDSLEEVPLTVEDQPAVAAPSNHGLYSAALVSSDAGARYSRSPDGDLQSQGVIDRSPVVIERTVQEHSPKGSGRNGSHFQKLTQGRSESQQGRKVCHPGKKDESFRPLRDAATDAMHCDQAIVSPSREFSGVVEGDGISDTCKRSEDSRSLEICESAAASKDPGRSFDECEVVGLSYHPSNQSSIHPRSPMKQDEQIIPESSRKRRADCRHLRGHAVSPPKRRRSSCLPEKLNPALSRGDKLAGDRNSSLSKAGDGKESCDAHGAGGPCPNPSVCAFCARSGSLPECEGELLGPFSLAGRYRTWSLYAHFNCLAWAPETFETGIQGSSVTHEEQWSGYDLAFKRARKKKCILCGRLGASLQCMFMLSQCCRPMHFRCAILSSATLLVSARGGLHTLCPRHSTGIVVPGTQRHAPEHRFIQTPVSEDFLRKGRLCYICQKSNFSLGTGALLDCTSCSKRMHSKCVFPDMRGTDGVFAVESKAGRFRCGDCLTSCDLCHGELKDASPRKGRATRDVVRRCVGCRHVSVHTSCLSKLPPYAVFSRSASSSKGARRYPGSHVYRCERCRNCVHCGKLRLHTSDWNEDVRSCVPCGKLYMDGAACPVCDRVYRDEDSDMIQCNKCEKWIHLEVCCGLSDEQIAHLSSSDKPYNCIRCMPAQKGQDSRGIADAEPPSDQTAESAEESDSGDVSNDVEVMSACEAEEPYGSQEDTDAFDADEEAAADLCLDSLVRDVGSEQNLGAELVPFVDLCRSCGSKGDENTLRFCANCGDAVHGFCIPHALPACQVGCRREIVSCGTFRRLRAGGEDPEAPMWHCEKCAVCKYCHLSSASDPESPPSVVMYSCSHCASYLHLDCLSRHFMTNSHVDHDSKSLLCGECQACEMCLAHGRELVPLRECLFCVSCFEAVRFSNPCSVCGTSYPNSSSRTDVDRNNVTPPQGGVRGRVCDVCHSLVHAACDFQVVSEVAKRYICLTCRTTTTGNNLLASSKPVSTGRSSACAAFGSSLVNAQPGPLEDGNGLREVGITPDACGTVVRPPLSSSGLPSSPSAAPAGVRCRRPTMAADGDDCDGDKSCKLSFVHHGSGAGNVYSAGPLEGDGRTEIDEKGRFSCIGESWGVYQRENITWFPAAGDDRACHLCFGKEQSGDARGRLLPFAPECNSVKRPIFWVHVMCVLYSSGVSRVYTRRALPRINTCFLVVDRKAFMRLARSSVCRVCGLRGATILCADESCGSAFHFDCARKASCHMWSGMTSGISQVAESVPLQGISWLGVYCPSHAGCPFGTDVRRASGADEVVDLTSDRRVDVGSPIRVVMAPNWNRGNVATAAKRRLRAGGVIVLRTGSLVPNCPLFVHKNVLIPTAYRAVRRHWSLKHPGRRCSYMLDIGGSARTGPSFILRASDDPSIFIRASSAASAWACVVSALEVSRCREDGGLFSGLSFVRMSGLEAFGLSDCDAVVSVLEKLPMSSLLTERYRFKFGKPEECKNLPFRIPSLRTWSPECASGCARVEGLVPERNGLARKTADAPTYDNVSSGDLFQLHVAMGLGESVHSNELANRVGQRVGGSVSVRRKSRASEGGEPVSVAFLSHAMQHRAMLRSWRRRTMVLRSQIDGWGVFATEDIPASEMIVEYSGEIIRPCISDRREKLYNSRGIGCYMFEISPGVIVDATIRGNRARYINHSCDPNCFSRTVTLENNRRVVVIFAKRNIKRGEELCYDYQFPYDPQDRILCACRASQCKGFMN